METTGLYDLIVGPYCETSTSQLSFPPVSEEQVPLFQPIDNPYPWALQLMNSVYFGALLYLFSVSHLNLTRTFYRSKLTSLTLSNPPYTPHCFLPFTASAIKQQLRKVHREVGGHHELL